MRPLFLILLTLFLASALVGCGGGSSDPSPTTAPVAPAPPDPPDPPDPPPPSTGQLRVLNDPFFPGGVNNLSLVHQIQRVSTGEFSAVTPPVPPGATWTWFDTPAGLYLVGWQWFETGGLGGFATPTARPTVVGGLTTNVTITWGL